MATRILRRLDNPRCRHLLRHVCVVSTTIEPTPFIGESALSGMIKASMRKPLDTMRLKS